LPILFTGSFWRTIKKEGGIVNQISYSKLFSLLLKIFLVLLISWALNTTSVAETASTKQGDDIFSKNITHMAEWFIGAPYKLGGDATKSSAIDNSHLICLIYEEAAKQASFRFRGYMPMKMLLQNTVEIDAHDIKVGDLIVLQDGHAALIYKFESDSKFYMTYASEKRQKVTSFNSHNVVYEAYWLKNLRGFFRLSKYMLQPTN